MTNLKLVGGGYDACPACGGGMPGEVADDLVCRCGDWTDPSVAQTVTDWEEIGRALLVRSAGRCEIRSPACLGGRYGDISSLPSFKVSRHHRRPRGMGGTKRADVHSLAALLLTCGDGTTGCHGYAERERDWARDRGILVPNVGTGDAVDPAAVPLVLHSGRRVLLDPLLPWYQTAPGPAYALDLTPGLHQIA